MTFRICMYGHSKGLCPYIKSLFLSVRLSYCSAWLRLNIKIGLHTTTHHHHYPPPNHTNSQAEYLSCYWSDLDQILIKGSWEHRQQITSVTMTFVWATFVLGTFVHNSNISAVTCPIWIKL